LATHSSWTNAAADGGQRSPDRPAAPCSIAGREKQTMKNLVVRLVREDAGQDLIEYALLAAFISLAAVAAIQQLGTAVNNVYTKVSATLNTAS
jgi:pilus assembly protein Flp/PilA